MSLVLSTSHLQARLQASIDFLSIGGAGSVNIYDGVQPAFGGTATNLLVSFPLSVPAGTIVGSATTVNLTLPSVQTIAMTGTATWARVVNGAGSIAFDCDVTTTGGTAAIRLSVTSLVAASTSTMTSATLG